MRVLTVLILLIVASCSPSNKATEVQNEPSETAMEENVELASFELRTYYAAEGKLNDLLSRFENHTMKIFEKYGIVNIAYWVPAPNNENQLVYLLGFESREARTEAWNKFREDPDWLKARAESEVNGSLVDSVQNVFLNPTDYSPELVVSPAGQRIFEMRTYYTNENKLADLHSRFRDHTMNIFEAQGMTNVAYFNLDKDQEGADNTLLYFISHADRETADRNWENFINDPTWKTVFAASRENGNLVNNLTSQFLDVTDFSPMK